MHPPSQSTRRWSRDQRRRIGAREETSFHYSVGVSSVRFSSGPAAALRVYFTVQSLPCFCWPKRSCVICNQKGSNKCTDERREKASICINDLHEKKEALLQWKRETRLGRSSTQPARGFASQFRDKSSCRPHTAPLSCEGRKPSFISLSAHRVLGTVLRAVPRGTGSLGSGNVYSPMACWATCPVHWEKSHSLVTGVDRPSCNLPSEDLQG